MRWRITQYKLNAYSTCKRYFHSGDIVASPRLACQQHLCCHMSRWCWGRAAAGTKGVIEGFCMLNIEKCIFFCITCQRHSEDPNSPMPRIVSLGYTPLRAVLIMRELAKHIPFFTATSCSSRPVTARPLQLQVQLEATCLGGRMGPASQREQFTARTPL